MICIDKLTVEYSLGELRHTALQDIDFALAGGETCAIIGPSGCGKSTLLKVLAGIITDYRGRVEIAGAPVRPDKQRIGFIPQDYGLLPWRNVLENSLLAARLKGDRGTDLQARVMRLFEQLGLSGLEERYPVELSGGQQQRVALARSFLLRPDLLLMDEPFSALDALSREEIQDLFLQVWRKQAVSTVLVTHQVEEAVYLGQKILVLSPTPGRIHKLIDNPLFGQEEVRAQPAFFELCSLLRKTVKEVWAR